MFFSFLQMGAYHTLDLELNRKFMLGKQEWDSVALERIGKMSCLFLVFVTDNWWSHPTLAQRLLGNCLPVINPQPEGFGGL